MPKGTFILTGCTILTLIIQKKKKKALVKTHSSELKVIVFCFGGICKFSLMRVKPTAMKNINKNIFNRNHP